MKAALVLVAAAVVAVSGFAGGYWMAGKPAPAATPATAAGPAPETAKPPAPAGKEDAKEPPPAPAIPVKAVAPAKGGGGYSVELGAFRSLDNAQSFATVLAGRGLPVEIVETVDAAGQTWRRVRAGRFDDVWQAEARRPAFERAAGLGAVVVAVPPVAGDHP